MNLTLNSVGIQISDNTTDIELLCKEYGIPSNMLNVYKKFYGLNSVSLFNNSLEKEIESCLSNFLNKKNIDPKKITHVIHTHTASGINTHFTNIIRRICRKNKINNANVFSICSNNCASPLNSIDIFNSQCHLVSETDIFLLICADKIFTEILQQIPNTTICGDGVAICCLTSNGSGLKLISKQLKYCGEYAMAPWLSLKMQADFEKKYVDNMVDVMSNVLLKTNLDWGDIKIILPHNVNNISWKNIATKLNIPLSKIYLEQIPNLGHCFGADIFINLHLYAQNYQLEKGDKIMLGTVGLGAVFGIAIFEYVD